MTFDPADASDCAPGTGPAATGPMRAWEGRAILLFADFSGFSALSARLVAADDRGAETIHDMLNPMIAAVIAEIDAAGGRVVHLAGDAVLALWPEASRNAAETCAGALGDAVRRAAPEGEALPVRVLLDHGAVTLIDTPAGPLYLGAPFARLPRTAPEASAARPTSLLDGTRAAPSRSPPLPEISAETAASHLSEFRTTTVLFARLDAAPDEASARAVGHRIAQVAADHDARILSFGIDDKGLMALLGWGLSDAVTEADADLAIAAATALQQGDDLPISCAIGRGRALTGMLGGPAFSSYTMLGPHVNAAAEALSHAHGTVLCDAATASAARRFRFGPAREMRSKTGGVLSFAQPTGEARFAQSFKTALIGREAELAALIGFAGSSPASGQRRLLWVSGEAGIGKSHLLAEAMARFEAEGQRLWHGHGERLARMTSLRAWREIFAQLPDTARHAAVDAAGELAALLNPVLPDPLDETDATRALDLLKRSQLGQDMMADLFCDAIGTDPGLLIFEDAHWIDSASWQLLLAVLQRRPDLPVILVTRPADDGDLIDEARAVLTGPDVTSLELGPFDRGQTRSLIAALLDVADPPDLLLDRVFAHCRGHALYTIELVRSLLDEGAIRVADGHGHIANSAAGLAELSFPDGIEAAIAARVARQPAAAQLALKVAAVQGRHFDPGLVAATLREIAPEAARPLLLQPLAEARLIEKDGHGWRFHHMLIREAAYGLLTTRQRQSIHAAIAREIEGSDAGAAIIAHHLDRAGDRAAALPWLDRAAQEAMSAMNMHEALGFAEAALAAADALPPSDATGTQHRMTWHRCGMQAALALGRYDTAEGHAHGTLRQLGRPHPAGTVRRLGAVAREVWRYKRGRPPAAPPDRARADQLSERVRAHLTLSEIYYDRQDDLGILFNIMSAMNAARALGARTRDSANAHVNMAMLAFHAPILADADTHLRYALDVVDDLDPQMRAHIHMVAGNFHIGAGNWDKGREHLTLSAAVAREARIDRTRFISTASLANMLRLQGRIADADTLDAAVFREGEDRSLNQLKIWALTGRVKSLLWMGDTDTFDDMMGRNRALLSDRANWINASFNSHVSLELCQGLRSLDRAGIDAAFTRYGTANKLQNFIIDLGGLFSVALHRRLAAGDDAATLRPLARIAVRQAKKLAHVYPPARPKLRMAQADLALLSGREDAALSGWRKVEETARALNMPLDAAAAAHRLAERGEDDARVRRDAALAEAGIALPALWT